MVLACQWSSNGAYLACITLTRSVVVFSTRHLINSSSASNYSVVARWALQGSDCITSFTWLHASNAIAVLDDAGKLHVWRGVVPLSHDEHGLPHGPIMATVAATVVMDVTQTESQSTEAVLSATESKPKAVLKKLRRDAELEDADTAATFEGDEEPDSSPTKKHKSSHSSKKDRKERSRRDEDDEDVEQIDDDDDFDEDAITADDLDVIREGKESSGASRAMVNTFDESPEALRASMIKAIKDSMRDEFSPMRQPAFQCGSTPANAQKQRFLAWNLHGAILCREDDTSSHVEIEFADANKRPYRFNRPFSFTLGALGEYGALLAAVADDEVPPTVWFQPFEAWVAKPEWVVQLEYSENPVAVAVGTKFAGNVKMRVL